MNIKPSAQYSTVQQPPKLLDQLRQHIPMLHYSIRTEQAYVDWVRHFILFHGKRYPRAMGALAACRICKSLAAHRPQRRIVHHSFVQPPFAQ